MTTSGPATRATRATRVDPVSRAREHRDSLRALAARLAEEYAGVATPGRVVAAAHRADRLQRGTSAERLRGVESHLRALLDALVARRDPVPPTRVPGPLPRVPRRTNLGG